MSARAPTVRVSWSLLCAVLATLGVASAGAQEGRPLFPGHFTKEEFQQRRSAIYDAIGSGALALVQSASGDHSSTRFRQTNQFYYLTGVETHNSYVLLDATRRTATLFLPHDDPSRAATDGAFLNASNAEQATSLTGIEEVAGVDRLAEVLGRRTPAGTPVYVLQDPGEGHAASRGGLLRAVADMMSDPWDGRPTREGQLVALLRTRLPFLEVRDLSPILSEMRSLKSPAELEMIRRATRLGGEALMAAMRSTAPGVQEHELDAVARFVFTRHGAQGEAYRAIVASGPNAWWAHHRAAGRRLADGDLVLMDFCPDLGYYRCDVTRMWPVSGRWTTEQRELYGFYLGFYEAILQSIRPGITAQQVKRDALVKMDALLEETRFSKPHYERAAQGFVEAFRRSAQNPGTSLGHGVGLSTHDPGSGGGMMRPGLVFTIEPQFRVPEERIYIRLEDMIAVTETGVEILSDFVPRDLDSIERIMAEAGLLQQEPRLADWDYDPGAGSRQAAREEGGR